MLMRSFTIKHIMLSVVILPVVMLRVLESSQTGHLQKRLITVLKLFLVRLRVCVCVCVYIYIYIYTDIYIYIYVCVCVCVCACV